MQCRKTGFKTFDQAQTRADYLNEKNKKKRRKNSSLRVYKCPSCGEFHLTHESLDEFRAKIHEPKKVFSPEDINNRIKQLQEQMRNGK